MKSTASSSWNKEETEMLEIAGGLVMTPAQQVGLGVVTVATALLEDATVTVFSSFLE